MPLHARVFPCKGRLKQDSFNPNGKISILFFRRPSLPFSYRNHITNHRKLRACLGTPYGCG
ncbi:hypothetical protein [Neisseria perflava]|uniref:hypothetical protein n=1 Tax=Neisseria perflava TaxID=33053 RepID=UPI0020A16142|nr:hypothetical protein [Neisseria perflava]